VTDAWFVASFFNLINLVLRDAVDAPRQLMLDPDARVPITLGPLTRAGDLTVIELIASRAIDLDPGFS
jgi:hypothetical protein